MIEKVKHIQGLFEAELPSSEYLIINSIWLSLMDLRMNGDLDILISSKLWNERFSDKPRHLSFGIPGDYEGRLRVHSIDCGPYGRLSSVKNNDDVVSNYRILIEGIPVVHPALYFRYKVERFLKVDKEVSKIPKWKQNIFLAGDDKKILRKWNKDSNDFKMLKRYFGEKKHLNGQLSHITENQWGLDDKFLLKFITQI